MRVRHLLVKPSIEHSLLTEEGHDEIPEGYHDVPLVGGEEGAQRVQPQRHHTFPGINIKQQQRVTSSGRD